MSEVRNATVVAIQRLPILGVRFEIVGRIIETSVSEIHAANVGRLSVNRDEFLVMAEKNYGPRQRGTQQA